MAPETLVGLLDGHAVLLPSMRPGQDGPGNPAIRDELPGQLQPFNEAGARWPRKQRQPAHPAPQRLPSMRPGQDGPGNDISSNDVLTMD